MVCYHAKEYGMEQQAGVKDPQRYQHPYVKNSGGKSPMPERTGAEFCGVC